MRLRRTIAAAVTVAAVGGGAFAAGATVAGASAPVYKTSSTIDHLVSPRCYSVSERTVTYFTFKSALGRYVAESPHVTTSAYIHCHT